MLSIICSLLRNRRVQGLVAWAAGAVRSIVGSDARYIGFIRRALMRSTPRAGHALKHYCEGGGTPLFVSVRELFSEDSGFASFVSRAMEKAVDQSATEGVIDVPQWRLSNPDWRLALGSFRLNWCVAGDAVAARVDGCYEWHPNQNRITKPVHEAAARLTECGASAFSFTSQPVRIPLASIRQHAAKCLPPRDRLYM